jgi:hypothetical protein
MFISEMNLPFRVLEQAMELPPTAKIVAIVDTCDQVGGLLKIRIASSSPPPEEYSVSHLSKIGETYKNPEKYKAKVNSFWDKPADSGPSGEAEVEVIKAR